MGELTHAAAGGERRIVVGVTVLEITYVIYVIRHSLTVHFSRVSQLWVLWFHGCQSRTLRTHVQICISIFVRPFIDSPAHYHNPNHSNHLSNPDSYLNPTLTSSLKAHLNPQTAL